MRKLLKRCIVFCFVILLTVNNFAAIVLGDTGNDFLTKEELEKMKVEFDDKIENYNISLDNKIDGAIAAYLSGLPLNKDTMKHNLGIYTAPLDIYMNFDDVDDDGFSLWGPTQSWRVFIGYYSAYLTGEVKIDAPKLDSENNPWQPRQWYNLEKEEENGDYFCTGGYKKVTNDLKYAIWGLSDTGLGTGGNPTNVNSHAYLFVATLRNINGSPSFLPQKYYMDNGEVPSDLSNYYAIKTGDNSWNTGTTEAPGVNGYTIVEDDADAYNYYVTYTSNESSGGDNRLGLSYGSGQRPWLSGFHSVLHSTQAATQADNYVNAITNNGDDYVHVLYDNQVRYSVRGDKQYGKGSLGQRVQADQSLRISEIRTSNRNTSMSRYVWALAVPYFTLIKEGWNKFSTVKNFDSDHFDNTSLIKASHVTQKFKGAAEMGGDLILGVSEGIYLCTPEKTADIELTINIDTTDLDAGDRPYILVNKAAINKVTLTGENLKTEGFKVIKGGTAISDTYGDYAKYLDNGENKLTIKECNKNEPVIMKILWDHNSKKKVVLNKAATMELNTEEY